MKAVAKAWGSGRIQSNCFHASLRLADRAPLYQVSSACRRNFRHDPDGYACKTRCLPGESALKRHGADKFHGAAVAGMVKAQLAGMEHETRAQTLAGSIGIQHVTRNGVANGRQMNA